MHTTGINDFCVKDGSFPPFAYLSLRMSTAFTYRLHKVLANVDTSYQNHSFFQLETGPAQFAIITDTINKGRLFLFAPRLPNTGHQFLPPHKSRYLPKYTENHPEIAPRAGSLPVESTENRQKDVAFFCRFGKRVASIQKMDKLQCKIWFDT